MCRFARPSLTRLRASSAHGPRWEALSPQTYKRPYDLKVGQYGSVAELGSGPLPWERGEKSRPKHQLYYQIMLGAIPMEKATADLVKAFGSDEELRTRAREKAAIGAVLVDRNGVLVEDNGIAVSSFGWALPLTIQLKLEALGGWPPVTFLFEHQLLWLGV